MGFPKFAAGPTRQKQHCRPKTFSSQLQAMLQQLSQKRLPPKKALAQKTFDSSQLLSDRSINSA
jgi:hypothetical protein